MNILLISTDFARAEMFKQSLVRENIYTLHRSPRSLTAYQVDNADLILFMSNLDLKQWAMLQELLRNTSKTPILFFNSIPANIVNQEILKRSIILNQSIKLYQLGTLVREIIQSKYETSNNKVLNSGKLRLNKTQRTLAIRGNITKLTKKEYFLLELLIRNTGQVTTRDSIIDHVWDKHIYVSQNTIEVYISRLRKKLGKEAKQYIKTIPCLGYQFLPEECLT